ncbi:Hypothetical protein FKW44_016893, partial [Caligus rogercresseyi]
PPDLNSMDIFLGATLSAHTERLAQNTKTALINSIMKQARKLDKALVAKPARPSAPISNASSTQKADGLTSIVCLNK